MDVQIIRDVLANWLGEDYPGLDDIAEQTALSLAQGVPVEGLLPA